MNELAERAKQTWQALSAWDALKLNNPASFAHDPVAFWQASNARYAAWDLGVLLVMDAKRIERALREDNEIAKEVLQWSWRVHRLALEWGLVVNKRANELLRRWYRDAI